MPKANCSPQDPLTKEKMHQLQLSFAAPGGGAQTRHPASNAR